MHKRTLFSFHTLNVSNRSLPSFSLKNIMSASDCSQMSSSTRSYICEKICCTTSLAPLDNPVTRRTQPHRCKNTHSFAFKLFFDFGMFEIRTEIHAHSGIFENRNGRIVCTSADIGECFTLRFAVLEKYDFAAGHNFQMLQCFTHLVFVFIVQMALEFD